MKTSFLRYELVDTIPRSINDGTVYVSRKYATAVHNCCCGCKNQVVTPLGPTDWKVEISGSAITVYPSIGNWSLPCRSHYWIDQGRVLWAEQWSQARIDFGRDCDRAAKQRQYGGRLDSSVPKEKPHKKQPSFWRQLWNILIGK